ncbi:MAG: hypothetical protein WDA22_17440 [Bacteroidota bacterium]
MTSENWKHFSTIQIYCGKLLIGDFSYLSSENDCLLVNLNLGKYDLFTQSVTINGLKTISRVRILLQGCNGKLDELLGTTWTDVGKTGICDFDRYHEAFKRLDVEHNWKHYMDTAYFDNNEGVLNLDNNTGASMYYFPSGEGDGEYNVFSLTENGKLVGAEIEFIKNS